MGLQPRHHRRRRARGRPGRAPPGAGGLRAARRAATAVPGRGMGIVRRGRRPDRPGHAGAGRAGLDLGHDRCPGPAVHPAVDGPAGAAGVPGRARVRAVLAQTGRYMPLSLRCATALFGHFGIEWDITGAAEEELAELAAWMHGVVAADASAALMSYVQLDESRNDQPAALRIPGLDPRRRYQVTEVTPGARGPRRSGLAIAPQRTLTAVVVLIEAV